uniref:Phosphatidylinositol-specific phospholipase C X domain-containing protein n=1 Tax=Panagrolaimus davidi TaxID=227884 RepID=A0A914PZW8_9BILA
MFWLLLLIFKFIQSPSLIDAQSQQLNTSIWMEQLLPQIGHLHLYDITLPGTHDAASFIITSALSPDPAGDPFLDDIIKIAEQFGIPVQDIIIPWAESQNRTLFEQALDGMRYFDLRAAYNGSDWFSYHFDLGLPIIKHLAGLQKFLQTHSSEILIIEVSHFAATNLTKDDLNGLRKIIMDLLSQWLYPRSDNFITINEMIEKNQRVIVTFSDDETIENFPQLWPASTMINSYANSDKVDQMIAYNQKQVENFNAILSLPKNALYKLSWTLTPQTSTIIESILGGKIKSLKELANIGNLRLSSFARPFQAKRMKLCQILLIDFQETSNIMPVIFRSILNN